MDNLGEQKGGGGGDGRWQVSGHLSADFCPWLIRAVSPRGAAVGMDTDPALTYSGFRAALKIGPLVAMVGTSSHRIDCVTLGMSTF